MVFLLRPPVIGDFQLPCLIAGGIGVWSGLPGNTTARAEMCKSVSFQPALAVPSKKWLQLASQHQKDIHAFSQSHTTCLCLRPENRPSVFAFFGVGWGWGGVGMFTSFAFARRVFLATLDTSLLLFHTHTRDATLNMFFATLDTSLLLFHTHTPVMLRWSWIFNTNRIDHSRGQLTKTVYRVQRGNPKVVARTGTIDAYWKSCKKWLPALCQVAMRWSCATPKHGNGDT